MSLKGSKTEETPGRLRWRVSSQPTLPYFAQKVDVEGYNDVSIPVPLHRRRNGHRSRTSRISEEVGDPATGMLGGQQTLKRRRWETHERTDMVRHGQGRTRRGLRGNRAMDGNLAKAERSHANRFQKALDSLED